MQQLWSLGIQDKQFLFVIKRILKAPIRMPDGSTVYPEKERRKAVSFHRCWQMLLNELDQWIDSQWMEHPLANRYGTRRIIRTSKSLTRARATQNAENKFERNVYRALCR